MKAMRKKVFIFAVLALIFNAIGCGQKAEWKEFSSDAGNFSVQMPGTPVEKTEPVNVEKLGTINMVTYTLEQKDGVYMAVYNDYPYGLFEQTTPDNVLDGARNGAVRKVQDGKLVSEQKIELDGNPGRDIVAEGTQQNTAFVIKARIYLVKYRLYQAMAITLKDQTSSIDAAKFLNSFKLKQ